jgi:hypothetical protein
MTDDPAASTQPAASTEPATSAEPASTEVAASTQGPASSRAAALAADRSADLVLAGVHLRLGSLALARAELETLAGRDALDIDGIVDLAEARWRTGDVEGAGEAATLVLDEEEGPLVALIVAAEAAAARGRPTEARRLAAKALAAANGSIDRIFAGMPRSPAWPPDPAAPPPAPTTMFDPPHGVGSGPGATRAPRRAAPRRSATAAEAPNAIPEAPGLAAPPSDGAIGLWGEEGETNLPADAALPGVAEALDQGRAALEAGDLVEASVQLALVLRLSTPLAPAVLDLVADRMEPELAFVRGDAYRLVGRELDARRAYARAAGQSTTAGVHPASSQPSPAVAENTESSNAEPPNAQSPNTEPRSDQPYEGDPA